MTFCGSQAYAGPFFVLTGATSHAVSGDPVANVLVPLGFVMTSWALRPVGEAARAVSPVRHAA